VIGSKYKERLDKKKGSVKWKKSRLPLEMEMLRFIQEITGDST
jgi:hypothetical protein